MACWIVDPNPTVDSEIPSDFYTTNLELKTYFFHFCTDFGSISPSSVSRGNTRDVLAPGTLKDIGLLSSEWIWWILCQPKKPWRLLLLGSVRRAMVCLLFFFSFGTITTSSTIADAVESVIFRTSKGGMYTPRYMLVSLGGRQCPCHFFHLYILSNVFFATETDTSNLKGNLPHPTRSFVKMISKKCQKQGFRFSEASLHHRVH